MMLSRLKADLGIPIENLEKQLDNVDTGDDSDTYTWDWSDTDDYQSALESFGDISKDHDRPLKPSEKANFEKYVDKLIDTLIDKSKGKEDEVFN